MTPRNRFARRTSRRGSLYVAVLGVTLIVSMMAVASMQVAQLQMRMNIASRNRFEARLLAQSGIELGIVQLNNNENWTTDYVADIEYPATPVTAGNGSFTWRYVDLGSQVRLDGIGRVGDATCVLSVDLTARPNLEQALLVAGNLNVDSGEALYVEKGPAVVHGALTNNGSIEGDFEAGAFAGAGALSGSQKPLSAPRVIPNKDDVFEYYLANGTYIWPPIYGSTRKLEGSVLTPTYNPWGSTNSHGVYIIDAQDYYDVRVKDCRIVGTLVIINLPSGGYFKLGKGVNWEPAYPTFPFLLADGNVQVHHDDVDVDESDYGIWNLNPPGAPYQGQTDYNENDSYPSVVAGIGYCSGELTFDGKGSGRSPQFEGLWIVQGNCTVDDVCDPTIKYVVDYRALPPPGFGDGQLQAASQISSHTPATPSTNEVNTGKWWGQYVKPNLPANTLMWRLTKLEVRVRQLGGGSGPLHVVTYKSGAGGLPGTLMEDISIAFADLPPSYSWVEVDVAAPGEWLPRNQGLCVCLEARNSDRPAQLEYTGTGVKDAPSGLLQGDGVSYVGPITSQAIGYRIEAEYTTTADGVVRILPGSLRQTSGS